MPGRREELLDAAVAVLADGGSRALTHRGVDAAAGAPAGSASNHFRTRGALLAGVLEHVLAIETAHYRTAADTGDDAAALARDTVTMVGYLVGPGRALTVARLVLGLEATWDAGLRAPFERGRATWRAIGRQRCARLGLDRPAERADALLALVDGVVLARLRGEEVAGVEPAVLALLDADREP